MTQSRAAASGTFAPEAASMHEHRCFCPCIYVSLIAITNYERGDTPGSTIITV
jgi:hypothetical protein